MQSEEITERNGLIMTGITLKAARVNVGLTQKEAAKRLNISNKTIWAWENGKSMPNANKIDAICNLYAVSYDDIIFLPNDSLKTDLKGL